MDWNRTEIISAAALFIATVSLAGSLFSIWWTTAKEKPIAWIEFRPTPTPGCWIADIHVRNRSSISVEAISLDVPIKKVPISRKQDFLLGDYASSFITTPDGGRLLPKDLSGVTKYLKFNIETKNKVVPPAMTEIFPVLLFRGELSDARRVQITLTLQTLAPKPALRRLTLSGAVPGQGIGLTIG
jgi:hypothetical protein